MPSLYGDHDLETVQHFYSKILNLIEKEGEILTVFYFTFQRAKAMKFVDGLMIHSGDPCNDYVDTACRHVLLRQGVLGIKYVYIPSNIENSAMWKLRI